MTSTEDEATEADSCRNDREFEPCQLPGHHRSRSDSIVTLNIGGTIFQTSRHTLQTLPKTKLCSLTEESESCQGHKRYFFDRNPHIFTYILDFYRTGELHIPRGYCASSIKRELEFWGLDESCITECCWSAYMKSKGQFRLYKKLTKEFNGMQSKIKANSVKWMEEIWRFLEDASSSRPAKIYAVATNLLILVNVFTYMLGTLPSFRISNTQFFANRTHNASHHEKEHSKLQRWITTVEHPGIFYFDIACLFFFFVECVARFIVCPDKIGFFKSFKTIADLFYIVPLSILHIVYLADQSVWSHTTNIPPLMILQGFVAFRVCRLVLVARNYRPFVILSLSLKASGRELLLLVILVMLALVFFSNAIFLAEINTDDHFEDVFEGLWWSLITITTVGYGDVVPKTAVGFCVGSLCAVSGLILISLPIPVIAKNFNSYYSFKGKPNIPPSVAWEGNNYLSRAGTRETMVTSDEEEEHVT